MLKITATSKSKSHPKQVPFKVYAKRFHINNQQMCIDCLKSRSNKNERGCKKMRLRSLLSTQLLKFFICSIAQVSYFIMYKNGSIVKN